MYKMKIIQDLKEVNNIWCAEIPKVVVFDKPKVESLERVMTVMNLQSTIINTLKSDVRIINIGKIKIEKNMALEQNIEEYQMDLKNDYGIEFTINFKDIDHNMYFLLLTKNNKNIMKFLKDLNTDFKKPLKDKPILICIVRRPNDKHWKTEPLIMIFEMTKDNYIDDINIMSLGYENQLPPEEIDMVQTMTIFYRRIIIYTLRLISCKNVEIEKVIEYKDKPIIKKGRTKYIKVPVETTEMIKVDGQNIRFQEGHFRTFTKEKPLFGKVTGTYWFQPIIRKIKQKGDQND